MWGGERGTEARWSNRGKGKKKKGKGGQTCLYVRDTLPTGIGRREEKTKAREGEGKKG